LGTTHVEGKKKDLVLIKRVKLTQGFEEALEVARFVKLVPVDLKASAYTKKRMIMFWNILHQNFPKNI